MSVPNSITSEDQVFLKLKYGVEFLPSTAGHGHTYVTMRYNKGLSDYLANEKFKQLIFRTSRQHVDDLISIQVGKENQDAFLSRLYDALQRYDHP